MKKHAPLRKLRPHVHDGVKTKYGSTPGQAHAAYKNSHGRELLACVVETLWRQSRIQSELFHPPDADGEPQSLAQAPCQVASRFETEDFTQKGNDVGSDIEDGIQQHARHPEDTQRNMPAQQSVRTEDSIQQAGPPQPDDHDIRIAQHPQTAKQQQDKHDGVEPVHDHGTAAVAPDKSCFASHYPLLPFRTD